MRTVSRYFDLTEAQVARGALRSISAGESLRDEHLGSINWGYLVALGGLRLETPDSATPVGMLATEFAIVEVCPELEGYEAPDWQEVWRAKVLTIVVWNGTGPLTLILLSLFSRL